MHEEYMRQALAIAQYAEGRTSPNPMVGAVIVKDARVVGMGWHRKAGTEHAEIHALRQAGSLAKDATVYVTLEPCSHYGRTPPCSQALIDAKVGRVVVAMADPNPLVSGNGIKMLRDAGIEVIDGVLRGEAVRLNEVFLKWITTKMPFVVLKTAMTLDGKIATHTGESQWITNDISRRYVHKLRDTYDAILAGIGTILVDDPSLTTRLPDGSGKNPLRIVVDSQARIPLSARVLTDGLASTIVAVTKQASAEKITAIESTGASVLVVNDSGQVDLRKLFIKLGECKISSVFVEGGAAINDYLIRDRLVDKVYVFIAPKIIGGKMALTPVGGEGVSSLADAFVLDGISAENLGGDILITGYAKQEGA